MRRGNAAWDVGMLAKCMNIQNDIPVRYLCLVELNATILLSISISCCCLFGMEMEKVESPTFSPRRFRRYGCGVLVLVTGGLVLKKAWPSLTLLAGTKYHSYIVCLTRGLSNDTV
jgi:hypothetical protein